MCATGKLSVTICYGTTTKSILSLSSLNTGKLKLQNCTFLCETHLRNCFDYLYISINATAALAQPMARVLGGAIYLFGQ